MLRCDDVVLGWVGLKHRRVVTVEGDLESELTHLPEWVFVEVVFEVDPCRRHRGTGEDHALVPAAGHDFDALDDVVPVIDTLTAQQVETCLDVSWWGVFRLMCGEM